ncbi:MAG: hypothetical protein V1927_01880 [Candidatus Omnitrophota bacterium]
MSCNKIIAKGKSGLTLVESVVSIFILTILLIGLLSTFYTAKSSALHAKHRMAAMNILKLYMEQEVRDINQAYDRGSDLPDADYYTTVTSADPVPVVIDDRGTPELSDDLMGTITPDPYLPDNIENPDGTPITYRGIPYKIVGFVAAWTEDRAGQVCTERAVAYVSFHSGA